MSFQINSRHYAYAVISIFYDREASEEDEQAINAYQELKGLLKEEGYQPYRLGLNEHREKKQKNQLLQQLKQQIDPENILAPDYYL